MTSCLQRDLEAKRSPARLPCTTSAACQAAEIAIKDLDLRNETDRARSQLLHQLRLLGITWGKLQRTSGTKKGTSFHRC